MVNPWCEGRTPGTHILSKLLERSYLYYVFIDFKGSFLVAAISLLITSHVNAQSHANAIVVHKRERTMELIHAGQVIETYKIALGGEPIGPKTRQGDHRTPEGMYVIDSRNLHSQFHRSLHISYQNAADKQRARRLGVPPGGEIYIHGLPNGYGFIGAAHRARDWTDGCIAVTDQEIEQIWKLVNNGTPVEIRP